MLPALLCIFFNGVAIEIDAFVASSVSSFPTAHPIIFEIQLVYIKIQSLLTTKLVPKFMSIETTR